jgi:hypothetical protein
VEEHQEKSKRREPPTEAVVPPPGGVKAVSPAEATGLRAAVPEAKAAVAVQPQKADGPTGTVLIVSLWPARLIMTGAPSGATYEWPRAGSVLPVQAGDEPFLMSKNHHGEPRCCGGGAGRIYFQRA